jgi:hypothetical protein
MSHDLFLVPATTYRILFPVAKKRKPKPFRAVTAVKTMAREQIGAVPPTRRVENTKKKRALAKPKHKPTTKRLLSDEL